MATAWLTYAWSDNETGDIDFVVQELRRIGLDIKIDRWNLAAGEPLWPQIEKHIQDPGKSDAWLVYATQSSLTSKACEEELLYALDRALKTRGETFPVIALVQDDIDAALLPAAIRVRLYVSLSDPDWKERVLSAAERRTPAIAAPNVLPFELTIHKTGSAFVIETRPRAGAWSPLVVGVPVNEKEAVNPTPMVGGRGAIPAGGMVMHAGEGIRNSFAFQVISDQATPSRSLYIFCKVLPSKVLFGKPTDENYIVPLT